MERKKERERDGHPNQRDYLLLSIREKNNDVSLPFLALPHLTARIVVPMLTCGDLFASTEISSNKINNEAISNNTLMFGVDLRRNILLVLIGFNLPQCCHRCCMS